MERQDRRRGSQLLDDEVSLTASPAAVEKHAGLIASREARTATACGTRVGLSCAKKTTMEWKSVPIKVQGLASEGEKREREIARDRRREGK